MLLETLGAKVDVANDGPSALELFAATRHAGVLLDIGLPDMDGYEVARTLRERFPGPGLTIIALSGHGPPEDQRRSREAGMDHHLTKPAQFQALRELLSRVTGAR